MSSQIFGESGSAEYPGKLAFSLSNFVVISLLFYRELHHLFKGSKACQLRALFRTQLEQ